MKVLIIKSGKMNEMEWKESNSIIYTSMNSSVLENQKCPISTVFIIYEKIYETEESEF